MSTAKKIHEIHTSELIRAVLALNAKNEAAYKAGNREAGWFDTLPEEDPDGEDDRNEWEAMAVELGMQA